ncbi:Cro/CI family transcriptional regulator [uncultured Comamonas sp.]|uniref:transcriptional regulator n=1 Tax=uncultured Comamonas sp. TaxID=114710 RepID=UPI0025F53AFF|nr:Cro/CI family transcriptional regulator [uncultured Comamonas sp.]
MRLSTYLSAERGRAAALARALGVKPVVVSRWGSGAKPVPIERCLAVERATDGLVSRQDLRPKDWWVMWPEFQATQAITTTEASNA